MDAAAQTHLRALLRAQRAGMADRWYRALAHTSFTPLDRHDVRAHLLALAGEAIDLLLADTFAPTEARAIGRAVAALHYLHPTALGCTLEVLAGALVADLPAADQAVLHPRLAALLGAVAHGYYAQAHAMILAEQEATQRPLVVEYRHIAAALRASEARLQAVVTNLPVLVFALDPAGVFTFAAGKGLAALGLTPSAVVGQAVDTLLADAPTFARDVRRALAGEECVAVAALGGVTLEARHTPMRDATGAVVGAIGVAIDIGERVRAAAELRAREEQLRTVVSSVPLILFAVDRAGTITLSAGRGLAALGRLPGELVGQSAWASALPVPGLAEDLRRALAGEAFTATATVRGVTFEIHYVPLRDPRGMTSGVSGVALDITARVAAERAARRLAIRLSPQEARVLPLLARADLRTYRAIGVVTYMAGETARGHAKAIARKFGLATSARAAIVTVAQELGLLEEPPAPPPAG